MDSTKDVAALVGRVLLAVLFLWSGYAKITGYDDTAGYMAGAGLPMVSVMLPLTILVELGAGIALVVGWKARWAAVALAAFTVVATLTFHRYWAMTPDQVMFNSAMFYKNVTVIGGLLMVVAFGAGRISVDRT